jgi:cryptochrome
MSAVCSGATRKVTWKAEGGIPTLAELGYPEPEHPRRMTGGETAGLALLENSVARKAWVASFDKPSTAPTAFDPISTTGLSPYMKFG